MTNFPSMKKVRLKIFRAKRNLLGVNHLSKSKHLECYFSVVLKNHALTYITKTNIYFFSKFLKLFLVQRYKDPRYKDIKTLFPIKKTAQNYNFVYIYIYIYSCTRISGNTKLQLDSNPPHFTQVFQSESTLCNCLNVKELLARSRRKI